MMDIASDLWNVFDLIAIRPSSPRLRSTATAWNPTAQGHIVFVQVTDSTSHSKRRNKIIASPEAKLCILAGCSILIQSWKKVQHRYQAFDEWITADQFVHGLPDTVEEHYQDQARLNLLDRKKKLPSLPP
jgi:hypothetical protein